MGNTQPTLKAATIIKAKLKDQRKRSKDKDAARSQGDDQANLASAISTTDHLRRYMQQQSQFEWLFDGVEKTRDIIFHPDFTLTAGGTKDDKGAWKVSGPRTLVASFASVQHVLQFDEGMTEATLRFPTRQPPTKMRPKDEKRRAREEEAKALANFEHFHQLPRGTAKLSWVKATSEGVEGWAKWTAEPPVLHACQIEEAQAQSAARQTATLDQIKDANKNDQSTGKEQAQDADGASPIALLLTPDPPEPQVKEGRPSPRRETGLGANADKGSKRVASDGDPKKERARARWNKVSANLDKLAPSRTIETQTEAMEEEQKANLEKQINDLSAGNNNTQVLNKVHSLPVIERWVPQEATEPQMEPSEVRASGNQYPYPTYYFDSIVTDKKVDDEIVRVSAIQRHNQDQVRQLATLTRNLKYVEGHGSLKALQAIRRTNDDAMRRLEELKNRRLNDPSPSRSEVKVPLYDEQVVLPTVNTDIAQAFLPKVSVNEVTGLIGEESAQQEADPDRASAPKPKVVQFEAQEPAKEVIVKDEEITKVTNKQDEAQMPHSSAPLKPETQKRVWKKEEKVEEKKEEPAPAPKKVAEPAPREKSAESDKLSVAAKKIQEQKFTQKQKIILQQQMQLEKDVSPLTSKETVDLKTTSLQTLIQDYRNSTEMLSTINVDEISVKENATPNLTHMPPSTVQSVKTLKKPKESSVLVTKEQTLIIPQSQSKLENFRTVKQNKDERLFREKPESRQASRQGTRTGMRGQRTISRPSSQASGQSQQKTLDRSYFPDINEKRRYEQEIQKQKIVSTSVDKLPNQGSHQRNLTVQYGSYNAYQDQAPKKETTPMQPKEERNRNSGRKGLHTQMQSMKAIPTEYQVTLSAFGNSGAKLDKPKNHHSISLPKLNHADLDPEARPSAKQLKEKRPSMVPSLPQALLADSRNLAEKTKAADAATSKTQGEGRKVMKTIQEQAKGSANYQKVKVNEIRVMAIGNDWKAEHAEGRAKVYVMQSGQKKKQAMDKDTLKQRLALDLTPINNMKEVYVTKPKQLKTQQNADIKEVQYQQELRTMNKAQHDAIHKPEFLEKKAVPVVSNQRLVIDQQLKVVDEKAPIVGQKPQIIDKQIQIMNQRAKEWEQKLAEMDNKPAAVFRMPERKPIVRKRQKAETIVHSPENKHSLSEHSTEVAEKLPHHSTTIKKKYSDAKIFELQNTRGKVYIASQEPHSIVKEASRAVKPMPKPQEEQKAPETLKLENQKTALVKMPVTHQAYTLWSQPGGSVKKKEPQDSPEKQPAKAPVKESPIKPQAVQKQPVNASAQSQPSRGPAEKEPQDSPEKDCAKAPVKEQPAIAMLPIKAPEKKQAQKPPKSPPKVPIKEKRAQSPPKVQVEQKPTKPPGKADAKANFDAPFSSSDVIDAKEFLIKMPNGDRGLYTGQMKRQDYLPHGKGTCIFDKGQKYVGYFSNGRYEGQGTFYWGKDHYYKGQWKDHMMHGSGKYKYPHGAFYHGEWKHDKKSGKGEYTMPDGYRYLGEYKGDMKYGYGVEEYAKGGPVARYDGQYKNDQRHGKGLLIFSNDDEYEGYFVNGAREGLGEMRTAATGEKWFGTWKHGQKHGQGTRTQADGKTIKGTWQEGKRLKEQKIGL